MNCIKAICDKKFTINGIEYLPGDEMILGAEIAHRLRAEGKVKLVPPNNGELIYNGSLHQAPRPVQKFETKVVKDSGLFSR